MLYLALTFWLLLIVLTAWGVQKIWAGMIKPRIFNLALLPGTVVAQLGHLVGLLMTGATIRDTTLIKDDDSAEPQVTRDPEPRVPILGPVIIAMLPLLACATCIFLADRYIPNSITRSLRTVVTDKLPAQPAGWWDLARGLITLLESLVNAIAACDIRDWRAWLFGYLIICLTIRMAPFPGYLRGALGAIIVLGIFGALAATFIQLSPNFLEWAWAVFNLTLAVLLLLLVTSLLIRGFIGLFRILREGE